MKFFTNLILFFCLNETYSSFLSKNPLHKKLSELILNDFKKSPIILDGNKLLFKKMYCKFLCHRFKINFKEYSFNNFILKKPYLNSDKTLIYVNDFLIKKDIILNEYEKSILSNIYTYNNLIIFQSINIKKNINTLNDKNLIDSFPIYQFPSLSKIDIIDYIYDMVNFQGYNLDLNLLNWNKYNIELLNYETLNILLFELNSMYQEDLSLEKLHNRVNNIIESLIDF